MDTTFHALSLTTIDPRGRSSEAGVLTLPINFKDVEASINARLATEAGYLDNGDVLEPREVTTTVLSEERLNSLRTGLRGLQDFLQGDEEHPVEVEAVDFLLDLLNSTF